MWVWVSVTRRQRAPLRAAAMATAAATDGVVLDPDAYDDDATDGTRGEGSEDFIQAVSPSRSGKRRIGRRDKDSQRSFAKRRERRFTATPRARN